MAQNQIASDASLRNSSEHRFSTWDGTELFYRVWEPQSPSRQALVLLHRGHEHSGRFQDFVDRLDLGDFWIFAWDARGHGHSPGERGYALSFGSIVRDLDRFVSHLGECYDVPTENIAIVANSIGAVVASTWVHDYAADPRNGPRHTSVSSQALCAAGCSRIAGLAPSQTKVVRQELRQASDADA